MSLHQANGFKMEKKNSSDTWRVFCAIDLPEPLRKLMGEHVSALRRAVPAARASWSRPESIHLTLKFLGETPLSEVQDFSRAVTHAVNDFVPFGLGVGGTGVFPVHGSPRVLWIGVDDFSRKLAELHARLESESEKRGFERETRPFRPHLTLGRLRSRERNKDSGSDHAKTSRTLALAHQAMSFPPSEITVSELLVMRSELSSAGSKYTVISRHALRLSDKL